MADTQQAAPTELVTDCHQLPTVPPVAEEATTLTPIAFARIMLGELEANSHKGDWSTWRPDKDRAASELNHHVKKLMDAMKVSGAEEVTEHCADVANIAMKITELFGHIPSTPSPTREAEVELPPLDEDVSNLLHELSLERERLKRIALIREAMGAYRALKARIAQLESELDTCRRQGRPHP